MVWRIEGVWCGIVICGGIGAEGDGNDEFSGGVVWATWLFCAAPSVGRKF